MDIAQLKHFVVAAKSNNFTQAATKCFTSRQNISYSVKSLEKELGVTLFRREKNEMMLTPEGREALVQAEDILNRITSFSTLFKGSIDEKKSLRVAVSSNLFTGIPNSIYPFIAARNARDISIFEQDCITCYEKVCSNAVDMAFIMSMERDFPGCEAIKVAKSPAYLLVGSDSSLAGFDSATPCDLLNHKILFMSQIDFQYKPLYKQLNSLNCNPSNFSIIASSSSMMLWVRTGESVAIVSKKFAYPPPRDTVAIPFADSSFDWNFYVLYSKNCTSVKTIMDITADIKDHFQSDSRCGEVIKF